MVGDLEPVDEPLDPSFVERSLEEKLLQGEGDDDFGAGKKRSQPWYSADCRSLLGCTPSSDVPHKDWLLGSSSDDAPLRAVRI